MAVIEALMDPAELDRLRELARDVPAEEAIVELGSYRGGSAMALVEGARAGEGAHVVCIDPWPQPQPTETDHDHAERQRGALGAFLANMADAGWPVTALQAHSTTIGPMWIQPVGGLFVDGDHSYQAVVADYLAWASHVSSGGWIAFHDYFDDGELTIPGDTARVIDDVVLPSGLWEFEGLTKKLWVARRR